MGWGTFRLGYNWSGLAWFGLVWFHWSRRAAGAAYRRPATVWRGDACGGWFAWVWFAWAQRARVRMGRVNVECRKWQVLPPVKATSRRKHARMCVRAKVQQRPM
eukprot:363895-Chlamydomonas_euryale.AAC.8